VRNIDEEQWSQGEHECWSINVSINVGVSINAKGGLLDNWFGQLVVIDVNPWRLMSTLGEVWNP
jgi:hypothetical protein